LLPDLGTKMKELMERKRVIDSLKKEVERYSIIGLSGSDSVEKTKRLESLAEETVRIMGEVEELGVAVRDLDVGLLDFPAERYGERVFLCWKYGEPEVAYWHRPEEGFGGRRALKSQLVST
jgi:hypothetical protein